MKHRLPATTSFKREHTDIVSSISDHISLSALWVPPATQTPPALSLSLQWRNNNINHLMEPPPEEVGGGSVAHSSAPQPSLSLSLATQPACSRPPTVIGFFSETVSGLNRLPMSPMTTMMKTFGPFMARPVSTRSPLWSLTWFGTWLLFWSRCLCYCRLSERDPLVLWGFGLLGMLCSAFCMWVVSTLSIWSNGVLILGVLMGFLHLINAPGSFKINCFYLCCKFVEFKCCGDCCRLLFQFCSIQFFFFLCIFLSGYIW